MSDHATSVTRTGTRVTDLTSAALLTALIAAAAWITLPLGAVPVTLQVFVVVLAALLLVPRWAAASMGLYVALGAIGLPIFSGAKGGVGVLVGPTGGYLVGFVAGALIGSLVRVALEKRAGQFIADIIAAAAVIGVIYAIGTLQLSIVTGMGIPAAVVAGVVPFIGIDLVKAAVAIVTATAVRKARTAAGV